MNIGIDIDGVILNFEEQFNTYAEIYDCEILRKNSIINKKERPYEKRYSWGEKEKIEFLNKYMIKSAEDSSFVAGAKEVIKKLKEDGHKLIVISARGATISGVTTEMAEQMKELAEEKFNEAELYFDKCCWGNLDKVKTVNEEKIDIFIDDSASVCKKISGLGVKTLYFRYKDMEIINESDFLTEISNWGEIYRYICNEEKCK